MNGLGFLIWRIKNILPLDRTIQLCVDAGVSWVSLKLRDGASNFNYVDASGNYTGNPDYVFRLIDTFRKAGISVGGWQFVYTSYMKNQADAARNAVSTFGLDHWLVDAEEYVPVGAMWKQDPARAAKALEYMNNLKLPTGFPVGLCSYRFPSYHREFPFAEFLRHSANTLSAPQVYWMQANNPGDQLKRTKQEYDRIRPLPMVPIGASFREWGWEPTVADIKEFVATAQELNLPGWGFWDLDEAVNRLDWLEAMSGTPVTPPVEEEEEPDMGAFEILHVQTSGLNVRDAIIPSVRYGRVPGVVYKASKVWFTMSKGTPVEVLEVIEDGPNRWARIGQRQYAAIRYDDNVFLA